MRAKIEAEASHASERDPHSANAVAELLSSLDTVDSVPQLMTIEAHAAMAYWRAFRDVGLREAKNGNLPRSWLRFANRQKGAQFLGSKHTSHPVNAMLNYAYVVEAGRLAKALAARGLTLQIGFLHADKKGRNSLVWDAIEPLRPAIDARVFAYIASREFARADFPQTSATTFRLARPVIAQLLSTTSLPARSIADAADRMIALILKDHAAREALTRHTAREGTRGIKRSRGQGESDRALVSLSNHQSRGEPHEGSDRARHAGL